MHDVQVAASTASPLQVERSHAGVSLAPSDFNGDGRSDIWLENRSRGLNAYWLMSGAQVVEYSQAFTAPPKSRVAQGDLNGDGRLDIVWKDPGDTGTHSVWLSGTSGFVGHAIPTPAPGWVITGVGDVDGNGRGDLLLTNGSHVAYWRMEGASVVGYSPQFPVPSERLLVANGDFNADGRLDLVWANEADRTLVLWQGHAGGGFNELPIRQYAEGWRVWGAGDVDGDGRADLLLTHPTLRMFAYWRMDGAEPIWYSPAFLLPGEGPTDTYGPVAVGDYNGDHRLDVLLESSTDRTLLMWQGDGIGYQQLPVRDYTLGWRVIRLFGKSGTPTGPYVSTDMDGDGASDALEYGVRSNSGRYLVPPGAFDYVMLADSSLSRSYQPSLGCSGARILATGYFDDDHVADIVGADNCGSGRVFMRLSGPGQLRDITIPTPAPGWSILGAHDIDGDGVSDLLLGENHDPATRSMSGFAYWIMRGATVVRYSPGFLPPAEMRVLAARGDFNGDGRLDLVWSQGGAAQNPERMRMWLGDGVGFTMTDLPSTAPFWGVAGAGDVNGDGLSDLVLQTSNTDASYMAYWLMDGTRPVAFSPVFDRAGDIREIADYNGDGRADVLLARDVVDSNGEHVYYENLLWVMEPGGAFVRSHAFFTGALYELYGEARAPR